MRLFYTDHLEFPLPEGHRFPLSKYRLLRQRLAKEPGVSFTAAPELDPAVVELAHDRAYVRAFVAGTLPPNTMRRIGFPWSPELVRRTFASAGGTLAATEDALSSGTGGTLAGGTHHAFHAEGSGFCVFNDIAIAIRAKRFARAAVVDLDVHQGDGTAKIFEDDPAVLTVSVHGGNNFPFRKQRSCIDVDLPDGTTDADYIAALDLVLPRVAEFRPEIVFYQSGVDGLAADRLGRLALTHAGLAERDRRVFSTFRDTPLVITLGGGYSEPIEATVEAHAQTFLLALRERAAR